MNNRTFSCLNQFTALFSAGVLTVVVSFFVVPGLWAQQAGEISTVSLVPAEEREGVRQRVANGETVWIQLHTFKGHDSWVYRVAFSPDGSYVASGGDRARVVIWDAHSGDHFREFMGDTSRVRGLAFSPDGKRLIVGGSARRAAVWDVETAQELQRYNDPGEWVVSTEFSPDGRYGLVGCRDYTAHLWDLETGNKVRQFEGHTSYVNEAVFSLDGSKVITAGSDNTVRVWEAETGEELLRMREHDDFIRAVAVFSDGRQKVVSVDGDGVVLVWDLESGEEIRRFNHGVRINAVAVSPDNRYSLTGGQDRTARLWDLASGDEVHVFESHDREVYAVAFSPDGGRVLTGGRDGEVHLWKAIEREDFRDWTNRRGRVLEAAYVNLAGDVVTALTPNAQGYQIPLSTLSEMDAAYARLRGDGVHSENARLLAAAETGGRRKVAQLLDSGRFPDERVLGQALFQAVKAEDETLVELLLDHGVTLPLYGVDGTSALSEAVRRKKPEIAKRLLGAGAFPMMRDESEGGLSPLAWALVAGEAELVELFVGDGADAELGPHTQQAVDLVVEGTVSAVPENIINTVVALDDGKDPGRAEAARANLFLAGHSPTTEGLFAALEEGDIDATHLRWYCESGVLEEAVYNEWSRLSDLLGARQDLPVAGIIDCDGLPRHKIAAVRLLAEGDALDEGERARLELSRAELGLSDQTLTEAIRNDDIQTIEWLLQAGAVEKLELSPDASLWRTVVREAGTEVREQLFDAAGLEAEQRVLLKARHVDVSGWE